MLDIPNKEKQPEMGLTRAHLLFALTLFFSQCLMACLAMGQPNITTDASVLLAFKSKLNISPSHSLSKNWSDSTSVCSWIGISCGPRHRRVTALDISKMELVGNLPPEIGNLSFLVTLNLSANNFHGSLPRELAHLRRLEIVDFSFNEFSGSVPLWIGFLTNLELLNLGNNSLSGFLPVSVSNMSKLVTLDLSYNSLERTIPKEIGNLTTLEILYLGSNNLAGGIPEDIGRLPKLRKLNLGNNFLRGSIPASIFNISSLQYINLENCSLTGPVFPPDMCPPSSQLQEVRLHRNMLFSELPESIGQCSALEVLSLSYNYIIGSIPRQIGNLTMLRDFHVAINNLTGEIPEEIGYLHNLEMLHLGENKLRGTIPTTLFNISALKLIALYRNQLSGKLPSSFGYGLPNLEGLYLFTNNFNGEIPHSISNCSKLSIITFQENNFSGPVPHSLRDLTLLRQLFLARNNFVSENPLELSFITSLTNCRYLERLDFSDNLFNGAILPVSIGNLSTLLGSFYGSNCGLHGSIPEEFANLTNLVILTLHENQFQGSIPKSFGNLQNLQGLALHRSNLSGHFPDTLCRLQSLYAIVLDGNQITGSIPDCIRNLTSLGDLYVAENKLNSSIPKSLWELKDLIELNLSSNYLTGSLSPDIGNLRSAQIIDLSMNQFSGVIPTSVGNLETVLLFTLSHNSLQGSIPESIGKMLDLEKLDLSHNNLSGIIPKSLESLVSLTYFNVSFNSLSGEIPSGGPFINFSSQSFISNEGLCGDPKYGLSPCINAEVHGSKKNKLILRAVYASLGVLGFIFLVAMAYLFIRYRRKETQAQTNPLSDLSHLRISYLNLAQATEGFSDEHLLGSGGFSSVYKGILQNNECVAIKVFNAQLDGAFRSFEAECEFLRSLRHRNLCKVITACSNEDFKALILEYMPNGSLEKWLDSEDVFLDIMQRISIMTDVASALEYLHHGYEIPVAHCDIKPSNVLLDEDMVGHLSDFGIAKLLGDGVSFAHTTTLATMGYIAPEYGSEGLVSIRCDVYSYGIMLMEVFARLKPSSEPFSVDSSLRSWVKDSVPNDITRIIDPRLLKPEEEHSKEILECLSCIMDLALKCSEESPRKRISMTDVVGTLKKIKVKIDSHHIRR